MKLMELAHQSDDKFEQFLVLHHMADNELALARMATNPALPGIAARNKVDQALSCIS